MCNWCVSKKSHSALTHKRVQAPGLRRLLLRGLPLFVRTSYARLEEKQRFTKIGVFRV